MTKEELEERCERLVHGVAQGGDSDGVMVVVWPLREGVYEIRVWEEPLREWLKIGESADPREALLMAEAEILRRTNGLS